MRRVHPGRPAAASLTIFLAFLVGMLLVPTTSSFGEDLKPKKKDTNPRLKSKNAMITTSVEPAEAKPGDSVTYKVTVKLDPGFHIYKRVDKPLPPGAGPVYTTFDFFDTAGLKVEGEWSASKEAVKHKEAVWPDLPFVEYYEDEVVWSLKLKVPDGIEPGKKTLRSQAGYMICDDKSCSPPGQWTVPDAELTVLSAGAAAKLARTTVEDLKPKKQDTNPRLKSKNAMITTSVEPAEAKPGDSVTYKVTVKLDPGFHIYKRVDKPMPPGGGPIYTSFDFFDTAGLKVEDEWSASKEAVKHKEAAWPNLPFVEFYEDEVVWSLKLKVPDDIGPGKKTLRSQAGYMVCNDKSCSPAGQWTLPDAELTVLSAGAAAKPTDFVSKQAAASSALSSGSSDPAKPASPALPASTAASPKSPHDGPATAPRAKLQSEIARTAEQGLLPFLLASALGGLFALLMPCVWPMVPITVNFFVKQGQGKAGRAKTTGLAITYCLSIIGVFTAVGVLFSFFFSASALQTLANNPWVNIFVATLFVVFGLSLLGLFEIRLPNFLLNASAQGEGRGGLIGVVFMALTLTITSFTCTFPVVGGLLVMAASGNFLYPIIGLATFATVLALPFFLLALSPSLIHQMPRSGDWMNALKVVGGLVEIGAALKFINTAELAYVTPTNAWINAQVMLTSWVVLAAVCGIYLLGLFRTDHDHDEVKIGPGRLVCGALFLGLALFMAPALFGHAPQGRIWTRLLVGLFPPDINDLTAMTQLAGNGGDSPTSKVKATSTDPAQAEREEKSYHGVLWGMSIDQARERAAAEKKPILVDFTGVNCTNCRTMEAGVFPLPEVVALLKKFVTVQLYTDYVPIDSITPDQREALARSNQDRLLDWAEPSNPNYVVLTPDGQVIAAKGGLIEPPDFVNFLSKALEKFPQVKDMKVAQAGALAHPTREDPGTGQK